MIATGRQESVRRFIELIARQLSWGLMRWEGEGSAEVGGRGDTGAVVMRIEPCYFCPAEVDTLLDDPTKVVLKLVLTLMETLEKLVAEMLEIYVSNIRRILSQSQGFPVIGARE